MLILNHTVTTHYLLKVWKTSMLLKGLNGRRKNETIDLRKYLVVF